MMVKLKRFYNDIFSQSEVKCQDNKNLYNFFFVTEGKTCLRLLDDSQFWGERDLIKNLEWVQWQIPNYVLRKDNCLRSKLHTGYNPDVALKFIEPLLEEFEKSDKREILNQFQRSNRNKSALSKLVGSNVKVLLEVDNTVLSILSTDKVDKQEVRKLLDWDEDKVQTLTYNELQSKVDQLSQLLRLISFPLRLQEDKFLKVYEDLNLPLQVWNWWFSVDDVNLIPLRKFCLNLFLNFNLPYLSRKLKAGITSKDSYRSYTLDVLNTLYLTMVNCNKLSLVRNLRVKDPKSIK